jgi:predicted enzyme related to lactoylglutathione lyase
MGRVVGVGGVFIKTPDNEAWKAWYRTVLGVSFEDWGGAIFAKPDIEQQVLSPFAADTDHFAPSTHAVMINLVVDDMDGILARAAEAGHTPLSRDDGEYGRFASFLDPAGVKLELWQPPATT